LPGARGLEPGVFATLRKISRRRDYKALMDTTKDKDMVTYNMALTILEQEVEHEEDLQSLREDLDLMVQRGSK
jgi:ferritin-like protein